MVTQLITAVFATYALASMIVDQEGPGGIFEKLRAALGAYDYGARKGPDGEPIPKSRIGRMIRCPYCVMPYAAAVIVPAALYGWEWTGVRLLLLIFGVVGLGYFMTDLSR